MLNPLFRGALLPLLAVALFAASASLSAPVPKGKEDKNRPDTEEAKSAVDPVKRAKDEKLQQLEARNRAGSRGNLKVIGLAFHNHLDTHNRFPADLLDKKGKAILSWRVALLPYIEQNDLYKQFKVDEPWDSKHNLALLDKMPKTFQCPRVTLKRKGYTVYQVFSGEETPFRPGQRGIGIGGIPDGLSNTIMAVEATAAVPWTKPADIPFDSKKDLPDFGKAFAKKPQCVMFDGSVRVLNLGQLTATTLKNAIMPADGNVLGNDW
jgi:hypothetical protein